MNSGGFAKIERRVIDRIAEVGPTAFAVYAVLAAHADPLGTCCPSVAAIVGASGRTVKRGLRQLERAGLLTRRLRRRAPPLYILPQGGYVLTVGCSPACHPTGRCYEHIGGPPLEQLATLAQGERETLHRVARMFDRSIAETHQEPRESLGRTVPGELPGEAFNRRTSWPEILEPHGWVCVGEHGGIRQWRRPGKATGASATTGLLSKQGNELFVCFSTSRTITSCR